MAENKKIFRIAVMTTAILLIAGVIASICTYNYVAKGFKGEERVRIYIPAGSSEQALRDTITIHLGEEYAGTVLRIWKYYKGTPEASHGSYIVEPGMKAIKFARNLTFGRQTPVNVRFNNVRTMADLAERIAARMDFTAEEFMQACDSVLPSHGFTTAAYPAAFFPDTYQFYWTASPVDVVTKILENRNNFWNDERRAQAAAMGLTPVQVATLASIVEEETNMADERPVVARLYLNRLERNMKLQADPTVKFAIGDFSLRRLRESHTQVESPYNTYLHEGLPPGPIRVVERTTIQSVLDAPRHDYLYMCAKEDGSGYHNFAVDYQTHLANARRYQRELDRRGVR